MSKAADSMLIWKESIYKNGFKCTSCGALLFDMAKDAPTEDLDFESVIPGLRLPARCRCGRCGTPAAVAQPNTNGYAPGLGGQLRENGPRRKARETVEVKMYAVGISSEEAYEWITGKPDEYLKVCREAKARAVHPDPQGRFHAFLYLHPKQRNRAYEVLRKYFKTAHIIVNPAYVDLSQ